MLVMAGASLRRRVAPIPDRSGSSGRPLPRTRPSCWGRWWGR